MSTKDRLLTTAISMFSNKGFDGVSVNDIVHRAKVNKRMVYHYFKSKVLLYQEALFHAYNELSAQEKQAATETDSLEDIVRRLIRVYFEFPRQHPDFSRLLRWENMNKGQGIKETRFPLSKDLVLERLRAAISKEADGIKWRTDLDAEHMLITIIGICQVYVSHRYTLSQVLHRDLGSDEAIRRGIENAEHYMMAGMRPSPKPAAASKSKG